MKHQDPERRLQILMSLGRVSLKAQKTGYALESFEKVLNKRYFVIIHIVDLQVITTTIRIYNALHVIPLRYDQGCITV